MAEGPIGIITGGLKGIGAATAVEFARLGGRLALTARSLKGGEELVEEIRTLGGEAICISADVREPHSHEAVLREVLDRWGRLDFVLANAGIGDQSRIATGDLAHWRAVIETNLLGVLYTLHAVLPTMLEQNSGHVMIMSSVSGRESYVGEPVYIASKWGQVGLAHALRLELQATPIRVTIFEPGIVDTPLTRENPKVAPLLEECVPLQPDDVARAVVFAFQQPPRVAVHEVVIWPQDEPLPRL